MSDATTCADCGAALAPGDAFCGACGTPVARRCPNCAAAAAVGDRFCGSCGTPLAPGEPPAAGKDAQALNAEGLRLLEQGDLKGATARFNAAIEQDPGFSDAYNNRGLALARSGRTRAALQDYQQALSLAPGAAEPHVNRGSLLLEQRRLDEAFADLNRAIRLDPEAHHAYRARALALRRLGLRHAAAVDLEHAAALAGDGPPDAQAPKRRRGGRGVGFSILFAILFLAIMAVARYDDGELVRAFVAWIRDTVGPLLDR